MTQEERLIHIFELKDDLLRMKKDILDLVKKIDITIAEVLELQANGLEHRGKRNGRKRKG